ncbi:MAG: T9SS type A sorting domain-containing protein [Ignavibacteriales bacterium]|nr:T9SS type A sorting domain-containing protein [Ignavibacteriales bacterium]
MRGVVVFLILFQSTLLSQTLLLDDFSYPAGEPLTSHGWSAHTSAGTNPILVTPTGLVYSGHPGSGTGNAASLTGTGEDVHRTFTGQSNKTLYVSFLISVQGATTGAADKYFLHLNSTSHTGKVSVRKSSGSIAFGLERGSEGAVFTEAVYSLNTVYLIVLRYDHVLGNDNDAVSLYVFEAGIPSQEPVVATLGPITATGTEPSAITALALRQADSEATDLVIDAIRVSTSWAEAGLPVELAWFRARAMGSMVELTWRTESEAGNWGFEVEKKSVSMEYEAGSREKGRIDETTKGRIDETTNQRHHSPFTVYHLPWTTIAFVPGSGTSSSPREYSFVDTNIPPGYYAYRLKQIDYDGTVAYSEEIETIVAGDGESADVRCYPNPFNGIVNFEMTIADYGIVTLTVYDLLGRDAAAILNENRPPGRHLVQWDTGYAPSGIYYYVVEMGTRRAVGKLVLVK